MFASVVYCTHLRCGFGVKEEDIHGFLESFGSIRCKDFYENQKLLCLIAKDGTIVAIP